MHVPLLTEECGQLLALLLKDRCVPWVSKLISSLLILLIELQQTAWRIVAYRQASERLLPSIVNSCRCIRRCEQESFSSICFFLQKALGLQHYLGAEQLE